MNRPNKWIAAGLGLFFTGVGQVYKGQFAKGLLFFGLRMLIIPFVASTLGLWKSFSLLLLPSIAIIVVHLYSIYDALRPLPNYIEYPKWYTKWPVYIGLIAFILWEHNATSDYINSYFGSVRSYHVTTSSMSPTINAGEFIMTKVYDPDSEQPIRGEIITYRPDIDGTTIQTLARIVGLPGDTIAVQSGRLFINRMNITYSQLSPDSTVLEHFDSTGSHPISLRTGPASTGRTAFGPFIIDEHEFFVMGDNRYNAYDSRFIGSIPRDQITGRLLFIYYSADFQRIGTSF